jgi:hypothetical protein
MRRQKMTLTKAQTGNKYFVVPNFDMDSKKITLTKEFYLDKEIKLIKDEEYFIVETDEDTFKIFSNSECVGTGKYSEDFDISYIICKCENKSSHNVPSFDPGDLLDMKKAPWLDE